MNLLKAKQIGKLLKEDFGMTSGEILSPEAKVTGGDITNSDSYAKGDERIPKVLFKKPLKRKNNNEEEDSEEFLKNNLIFRTMTEADFLEILNSGKLIFKRAEDDLKELDIMANARSNEGRFKDKELTETYISRYINLGYKYFLSFFRGHSFFSNLGKNVKNSHSLIVFFDKNNLKTLRSTKLIPFSISGNRKLKGRNDEEAEDRLISKLPEIDLNMPKINSLIKGVYISPFYYDPSKVLVSCKMRKIPIFGDYKKLPNFNFYELYPQRLSNFKKITKEESEESIEIPYDFFTNDEKDKIEKEADLNNKSYYEVALKYYKMKNGLNKNRKLTLSEIKKQFATLRNSLK